MEKVGEILKQNHMQTKVCDVEPKFEAEEIYKILLFEMQNIIKERKSDDELILNAANKQVIGQVALWYSWDNRFKGDVRKGLMIRGNVGTGKSLIVQALCRMIPNLEILNPILIHVSELQDLYVKGDFDKIDKVKNRWYTFIDDVGVEAVEAKSYGNVKEPFNDVFDYRYRKNRRTVITTNLTPSEIAEIYGTRIIDRFRECMNDLVLDGKSFRK